MISPDAIPAPVAVIGAAGFLGSRLSAALQAGGIATARFTRAAPAIREGALAAPLHHAQLIFYLAGSVNPKQAEADRERTAADHRLFVEFLDRLEGAGRRAVVVLPSSGGTVYDCALPPPYVEESPTRPTTAYGIAKLRQEEALLRRCGAVRPVVLRLANVYGPGQRAGTGQGVVAHWLHAAATGTPLRVYGDPETRRDYVYIDDVIDVMLRVCERVCRAEAEALPTTINIGSGVPASLRSLLLIVRDVVGRDLVVQHEPARGFDRRDVWLDVGRASRALGWRAQTSLERGVAASWRAWRRDLRRA